MLFLADPSPPPVLPRPAWRSLYTALAVPTVFGAVAIVGTAGVLRGFATAAAGLACFATIAVWIRRNAVALAANPGPSDAEPLWPYDAR